jgi:transcriptional regulator with XRE-family HTH domain
MCVERVWFGKAVYMETKDALAEVRKKAGLTQEEMADMLFVTRQAVSRWETGETIPNVDTLKLISSRFNVSTDMLLGQPESVCQSCAMPLRELDDFGTDTDGGLSTEYCVYCYQDGRFTNNRTLDEMIESNLHSLDEFNRGNGTTYSEDEARTILKMHLATLKRWKA